MCDMSVLMGFYCRAIFSLLQNGFILLKSAILLLKKDKPSAQIIRYGMDSICNTHSSFWWINRGISEVAKKKELLGALLASLPLLSVAALLWLYHDTGDSEKLPFSGKTFFGLFYLLCCFFLFLYCFSSARVLNFGPRFVLR